MFKIIGADGKEYGPVTTEQIRQWIAEGRANAQTKVQPEGVTEWQALGSLAEFADAVAVKPPTIAPLGAVAAPVIGSAAADMVNGPAIGLMVTAALGVVANLFAVAWSLFAGHLQTMPPGMNPEMSRAISMLTGTMGVVSAVLGLVLTGLVFYGALQMKKLSSYGWAMTATILALVPCTSPCCLTGLPIGIWALVVLLKPEVKAAFH